jgi:hypothetical protein
VKLTIIKSINANRLNPKTGVPYSEPETTIPYGAILTYRGSDGDSERFDYMTVLYRCKRDVLSSAIEGGKIPAENGASTEAAPVATKAAAASAPAPEPSLKFEKLNATPYAIARAKVPGGWLVLAGTTSIAFYPDPDHAWTGESL